ncbi:hypothetical protein GQ457_02G040250 [Hibiscus cannabinus]
MDPSNPWVGAYATLRPRINPYGLVVTPRVAPTPTRPRTIIFTIFLHLLGHIELRSSYRKFSYLRSFG